jgi:hypothetical protein
MVPNATTSCVQVTAAEDAFAVCHDYTYAFKPEALALDLVLVKLRLPL